MPAIARTVPTFLVGLSLVLSVLAPPASGSGGILKKLNDGRNDGFGVSFSNSTAEDRYMQEYVHNTLMPGSIACGGRVETTSTGASAPFTNFELRFEDPANPGYCDVSPGGLLALADSFSFGPCGPGDIVMTPTFGNGSGVAIDAGVSVYFTVILPIQTNPDCGIYVDLSDPDHHTGKFFDSKRGHFGEAIGNLMADLYVYEPGSFTFSMSMHGSQRYPGDAGSPVMFARRKNSTSRFTETDDFITSTVVFDNLYSFPVNRDITIEVDRSALNPRLGYRDVSSFFKYAGSGYAFANPMTLQPGRNRFDIEVPRILKSPVVAHLPLNLRFRARVWDPDQATGTPTSAFDVLGLRPEAGSLDDGSAEAYTLVRSPAFQADTLAVRFKAIDLPRSAPFTVTGALLFGREVGGSGFSGFDALQLRRDDIVMAGNPDLSPQGLLSSFGTVDGIGEIPAPGPTVVNFPDVAVDPTIEFSTDLWLLLFEHTGDRTTAGTTLGFDTTADTITNDSYLGTGGYIPYRAASGNLMMRLLLEGSGGTLPGGFSGGGQNPENIPVRQLWVNVVIDYSVE